MKVTPIGSVLGARIDGVDLSSSQTNETTHAIQQALVDHGFIVFPGQQITPEQHLAFGAQFGPLNVHPHMDSLKGYPEILNITKEPDEKANFGGGWHTDLTFMEEPPLGSILYAREIPTVGGDTLFANMFAAYDALSGGMKDMLDGMVAIHSATKIYAEGGIYSNQQHPAKNREVEAANATCEHPVVRTHPDSGRKLLFVNPSFTLRFKNMTKSESKPILKYLYGHATSPEFVYRHQWHVNEVAMWDNRSTQHYALNDYHGQRRTMHRVTVNGDRPF
jgi:taurine dioxygenase